MRLLHFCLVVCYFFTARLRLVRLYGSKSSLEVDFDARLIRRFRPPALPGALGKVEMPARHLVEAAGNLRRAVAAFIRSDLHYFAGMNELMTRFYDSIENDSAPPIAYRDILRVSAMMDEIFRQVTERGSFR